MTKTCPAYERIEAAAIAVGRPLIVPEVVRIIETDAKTKSEFERINDEIATGAVVTDADIAARVSMPLPFVRSFLLAIRGDAAAPDKTKLN